MSSKLPPTPFPTTPASNYRNRISDEVAWLMTVNTTNVWSEWAGYHSQRSRHAGKPDISVILPIIDAPVHTLDTQYHCMEIVEKTTQLFNPGQIYVDKNDQPVYKLSKELQWRFRDRFGREKYFCLLGSLHLEKSILLLCGSLIEGIIHCWDGVFGVSKPHEKGKVNLLIFVRSIREENFSLHVSSFKQVVK